MSTKRFILPSLTVVVLGSIPAAAHVPFVEPQTLARHPWRYLCELDDDTLELIEQKVQGQEITAAPAEESKTKIIDLMAALKASIEEDEKERKPASRAGKKKKGADKPAKKKSARKKAASG